MLQSCVSVGEESQVGEARRTATRVAEAAGLGEAERGRAALIATELAQNLVRYGKDGRIFAQVLDSAAGRSVEILAVDAGAGMTDVARCLEDGYSTGGTPGTGLGAVRRTSSEFDVYSRPNSGTAVMARVASTTIKRQAYEWGAVSTCARAEHVCGDGWRVAERNGQIAVMVSDGLGHGPLAAEASDRATAAFDADPFRDPFELMSRAHTALHGSRGAAMAAAHAVDGQILTYAGVGNISGSLCANGKSRGLFSHNGTVGVQMRAPQQMSYDWPDQGLLIMHTDGLTSRWSLDSYPGLTVRHPAIIASVLHRDCLRGRDDATIVVVRSTRQSA